MGEGPKEAMGVALDGAVKPKFHGVKVTSDAVLLACRELDEALGLTEGRPRCSRSGARQQQAAQRHGTVA